MIFPSSLVCDLLWYVLVSSSFYNIKIKNKVKNWAVLVLVKTTLQAERISDCDSLAAETGELRIHSKMTD